MADDIRQLVAIEASQAIQALRDLDTGLKTFSRGLNTAGRAMGRFNATAAGVTTSIGSINSAFQGFSTGSAAAQFTTFQSQASNSLKQIRGDTGKLTTSLTLLSRVVFTQQIVRGLSQIRAALSETVSSTIDFQKQIALAQTIAGGTGFEKLSDGARKLASSLGIDQVEVAAGLFQTLSNQVGDAAESFKFLEVAGKFAKATGSTTSQAVDLISGALKSFNLPVEQAESVASKFFVALDKGRLTASELANSFGRVGAVAGELGVSIDEVNAFLAASTITGTKASEAITQLRGVQASFLKPSKTMGEALKRLGFDSGEAAIRALGLKDAVKAVTQTAGGNTAALGKLFPNVRALTGVVAALNTQEQAYNETLKESITSVDLLSKKFAIVAATDAEQFTKAINKISTAFSEGFGDKFLSGSANILNFFSDLGDRLNRIGVVDLGPMQGALNDFAAIEDQKVQAAKKADDERLRSALAVSAKLRALGQAELAEKLKNFATAQRTEGFQQQIANITKTQAAATNFQRQAGEIAKVLPTITDFSRAQQSPAFQQIIQGITSLSSGEIDPTRLAGLVEQVRQFGEAFPDEVATGQLQAAVAALNGAAIAQARLTNAPSLELLQAATRQASDNITRAVEPARQFADQLERSRNATLKAGPAGGVTTNPFAAGGAATGVGVQNNPFVNGQAAASAKTFEGALQEATANLSTGVQQAIRLTQELDKASKKSKEIKPATTGSSGTQSNPFFATGGLARGTDTIPAMLSPGEFVVNASASQKFFSQLMAINSGREPIYRAEGGPVTTNVNVGDVHIHGAKNASHVARGLMGEIRREVRKNSSRL